MQYQWSRWMAVVGSALCLLVSPLVSQAQVKEQFVPLNGYWVGPYAPGGSGFFGGLQDYLDLINNRDGGINGVKFTYERCETEYTPARGVECYERSKAKGSTGATVIHPLSTAITYALLEKAAQDKIPIISMGYGRTDATDGRVFPWVFPLLTTYWSQATTMVKFIGDQEKGNIKGKKIVLLYHDSPFGKEPIPVLTDMSKRDGFELVLIPVAPPGNEQGSHWQQIRQAKPDYVILWGWGTMNTAAIQAARRVAFPADKIIGVWWAGAEEDVIPAGDAAKGYIAAGFNVAGKDFPVIGEIMKHVYGHGKGAMEGKDRDRIGQIYYNRGIVAAILTVEAVRIAQEKYGKGKPVTGEQVRWALERLNVDDARLKALGALGLMPPLKTSCLDHEGSGLVKYQQWDGQSWKAISDWVQPDRKLVRDKVEESAAAYAKEKNITPRDCSKES